LEPINHKFFRTNHPDWNESYYFVFYDKKNHLGGMTRLGFKPNKQEGMCFFFLFLPDDSAAGYFKEKKVKDYTKSMKVGGIVHKCLDQEKWAYKFDGSMIFVKNPEDLPKVRTKPDLIIGSKKVSMDLLFVAINDTYEYSKHMTPNSLKIGKKAGDKHWEQIAEINGSIEIDEISFSIKDIIGQRDHTYGVRDWTGVGNWLYYVIWFNKDLAINPAAIITDDEKKSIGGFLYKEGRNIPIMDITIINQKFRKDGIFPISSELHIVDEIGKEHRLKAKVGPIIPVPFRDKEGNQSILVQSMGSFELDGIKEGYGSFETLRRIRKSK
jgi:hypothetical protein